MCKTQKSFLSILAFSIFLFTGIRTLTAQSFKLSGVSDMVRVFEDGYKLPPMYDSVNVFGIRGEIISGQFVISARKNLSNVTVDIGELKNSITGNSLPAASVEWNFVGSIPLSKNTPNQPLSVLVRQAPVGNEDPFRETGMHIGDAWHVYPAKDGVLNSVRWEEMRNGIQDYEYFWMLENKVRELKDSLGSHFAWIDPKQRGKEIAGRVIQSFAERTNDPWVVNKAKMLLINELMDNNTSPAVYVQTNPPEGASMTMNSSVEVFGWTEPGTKIIINRKDIPVSGDGLFLEQFTLSPANNKIIVQATKGERTKEILREFF